MIEVFIHIFSSPLKLIAELECAQLDFEFLDMFFETAVTLSIFKLHTYIIHQCSGVYTDSHCGNIIQLLPILFELWAFVRGLLSDLLSLTLTSTF